ncbi:hypothetical protein BBJ28_00018305 [Nothophytophthora sp. Chile5]|nr:hypothetical protein BBJ28_00018305 [Nothophytophthora sp. Chile5]
MATADALPPVAAAVTAAWTRWQRYHQQHPGQRALDATEAEAQFELVATGLALHADQVDALFLDDAAPLVLLLTPLPLTADSDTGNETDSNTWRYLFTLVAVGSLLTQHLERSSAAGETARRLLLGGLGRDVLLPVLQFERYGALHHAVLDMLQSLLRLAASDDIDSSGKEVTVELFARSHSLLLGRDGEEASGAIQETEEGERSAKDDATLSYASLCSLLELLLLQDTEQEADETLVALATEICAEAVANWHQRPQFLRAVSARLVPSLLRVCNPSLKPSGGEDVSAMPQRLLKMVLDAWTPLGDASKATASPRELLYLVCILMPKAPLDLIADTRLQQFVCFALRHNDALLRKQGLHILKVAFSHCALLSEPRKMKGTTKNQAPWMVTWQSFLTASEVIQMHHEQHLIEQVWPQVAELLGSSLIVSIDQRRQQEEEAETQWPVRLTFEWVQSLLVRVFAHDNPVVKRLFLSNFMEICVKCYHTWQQQHGFNQDVDRTSSFASAPVFQQFVLVHVLRACNDPVLFKNAHRARFQGLLTDFLASFLAFRLGEGEKKHVLDGYVNAMEEAVFGEGADSHSPEALLSMMQVFQAPNLVRVAASATVKTLLSAAAVDRLRFLLDVHAMQSFSQAMRAKMLRALTHALTGGFACASQLSLSELARVLGIFPTTNLLANDGETLQSFLVWLNAPSPVNNSYSFSVALASALRTYLTPASDGTAASEEVLSPSQLARLLVFTAEDATTKMKMYQAEETLGKPTVVTVTLQTSLGALITGIPVDLLDDTRLVLLVSKIEEQVQELVGSCSGSPSRSLFTFVFQINTFYSGGSEGGKQVSCAALFDDAMTVVRRWLDQAALAAEAGGGDADDQSKEDSMELVTSAAFVLTQMATHTMNESGDLSAMTALDALCEDLTLALLEASERSVFDLALAAKCLSIVSANAGAIDSLRAFESPRMLPLLLALDTSRRYSGRLSARCAVSLAASKWILLHRVLEASTFTPTELLQRTHDACMRALPTAGMDPLALLEMVHVLSLTLSQLAGSLSSDSDGVERLDGLLDEIWSAYNDSKAKPDALTRAVVVCMFQPAFLLRVELSATMKRWVSEFLRLGSRHRPNVIFHLACRLCLIWRARPTSALSFADELVELLLYKEPLIDEKEQLTADAEAPFQGFQGFSPIGSSETQTPAIAGHAKDRFVRLVVLSFLDDVAVESATPTSATQQLMDALVAQLLALNVSPDWQKQHMLNSDGFGKKLRSWQALCVISAHVTRSTLLALLPTLQTAFEVPQLPSVRYYMELFGMRLATRFPREICSAFLLPMLRDVNLMPQVGASLLLVAAYLAHHKLDGNGSELDAGELLETMLPWLNTSHGYTRVLAQFLLAKLLPRHVHRLELAASNKETPGLRFLQGTARFLSDNKECKRMLRRQARQLEEFRPDYESSLLGLLASGFVSEFGELLPRDEALRFSDQLKTAMNELYAQYQRENFPSASTAGVSEAPNPLQTGGSLTVQRKIDTTALLLEDGALPAVMRADLDATRRSDELNARRRPRQPVIMCASLVDKVPNLAGLARTCEIFNAQTLVVPNARVATQDATFATVSATAHKWMPLEEVRPQGNDLREALIRWKREGYTIVAVEQTASSVSLATYSLPRKMVVVLGREKEGIPVDVLQLVDVCVEIPQFGLVRSLNVHVSGALLLWEYTQQQLLAGAMEEAV